MVAREWPGESPSGTLRGALWMTASAVCYTAMVVLIKLLDGYSPALLLFYGQLAIFIGLAPAVLRVPRAVSFAKLPLLLGRSLSTIGGVLLAYYSFQTMPMADANALSFTRALWIAPLAAVFLGERVGLRRAAALAVGFAGVLIVLNPAHAVAIGWPHAAAVGSAMLFAFTALFIKLLAREHGTFSLLVWSAAIGLLLSLPVAAFAWKWPSPGEAVLLVVMGVVSIGAQICYIKGLSSGDAAALAPIDYLRLVFAVLVGVLFFREYPTSWVLAGSALIIGSTFWFTYQEARAGRRQDRAEPPIVDDLRE